MDCKSIAEKLNRFESYLMHQINKLTQLKMRNKPVEPKANIMFKLPETIKIAFKKKCQGMDKEMTDILKDYVKSFLKEEK